MLQSLYEQKEVDAVAGCQFIGSGKCAQENGRGDVWLWEDGISGTVPLITGSQGDVIGTAITISVNGIQVRVRVGVGCDCCYGHQT